MLEQKYNEEQKAGVENSQPAYCKTDVACCVSSEYKQVETEKEIIMSNSKCAMSPVATLKDGFGGVCQTY